VDRRSLSKLLITAMAGGIPATASRGASGTEATATAAAESRARVTPLNMDFAPGHLRRYGAIGDGTADDTAALSRAIAVLNAGGALIQCDPGAVYLCGPLPAITAAGIHIDGRGAVLKARAASWMNRPDGSTHLPLVGARARISHLTLDGNQAAFDSQPSGGRLLQYGDDALLLNVTVHNSPGQGARSGGNGCLCIGCHFDDNANLGLELNAASNSRFIACTWNRNGYGFGQTFASNTFAAFGLAVRYRSHHLDFDDCEASQNGRDGFAVGQGSYACRFMACTAWMNGDGGFTIHSDDIAPRMPGNHEACFDLEYQGCDSYNNYGSGLVSFAPVHNVTVLGGRYYNNHRLAGTLPFQSSYPNGIYFAGGSRGLRIQAKAYDDRCSGIITAVSGEGNSRDLQVTGWTAGAREAYPKVVFHDDDGHFKGYGQLNSESAGAVGVSSLPFNGVVLSGIAAGWTVSQRVQHNGCFLDNGCQGEAGIDGFGFVEGPMAFTGWKVVAGYFANGQNVRLLGARALETELLRNAGFDADTRDWVLRIPSGGDARRHEGNFRRSEASLQLRGGSHAQALAEGGIDPDGLRAAAGAFVEFGAWCHARTQGSGGLRLVWEPGQGRLESTVEHPGGGWKYLLLGACIPPRAVAMIPILFAAAGAECYFDTASLRVVTEISDGRDTHYPGRFLTR
jgi:hypothetical protein